MSNVDDELRRALAAETEENNADGDLAQAEDLAEEAEGRRGNLGLLIALVVMATAVFVVVMGQDSKDLKYAKSVEEVFTEGDSLKDKTMKVQGALVPGSLLKRDDPCEYRFKIHEKGKPQSEALAVRYAQCIVPDTFRDVKGMEVEVTVHGRLAGGYIAADQIEAKCPSRYEMQQRQAAGEAKPHGEGVPVNPMMDQLSKGEGS